MIKALKQILSKVSDYLLAPEFIVACTMAGMGWSIAAFPAQNATRILGDILGSNIDVAIVSLALIYGGIMVAQKPRNSLFILYTAPFLWVDILILIYFIRTPGSNPGFLFIYGGYYGLLISLYFTKRDAHVHRPT